MATGRVSHLWDEFWLAVTFLTTLPAPSFIVPAGGLGLAGRWFPFVGLVIGLLLWSVQSVAERFFAPSLAGALVVLAWVERRAGTRSRERRLE